MTWFRLTINDECRIAGILLSGLLLAGCGAPWPPESPRSEPLEDFGNRLESEEIGYVYKSPAAFAAADGSTEGTSGWGFIHRKGEINLGFSPFVMDKPQPGYVESQVEVVFFADSLAQLRIDPDKGDHLLLINNVFSQVPSIFIAGARLRVGNDVYELHGDGWWVDGKRVHAFGDE